MMYGGAPPSPQGST
jgi:hypothetical protein